MGEKLVLWSKWRTFLSKLYRGRGNGSIDFYERETLVPLLLLIYDTKLLGFGEGEIFFPSSQVNRTCYGIFYNYAKNLRVRNQ